jgi:hypothetical protein
MEQHPANYAPSPAPQPIYQPMPTNDDPNNIQNYPQSSPPPQYTGPPTSTRMNNPQGQSMQTYPPLPPQQQQQDSGVIVSIPEPMNIRQTLPAKKLLQSPNFACVVFCCSNPLFGFIYSIAIIGRGLIHTALLFIHWDAGNLLNDIHVVLKTILT